MGKYTPGPWNCSRNSSSGYDIICAENSPVDVCVVSRRDKSQEEINSNARLIAAAPELLAALLAVVSVADRKTDEFDLARAAIAKATGSQP